MPVTDWDLLKGRISPAELFNLIKGNLMHNAYERLRIRDALLKTSCGQLFDEMFDLQTAGSSEWSKDGWYCICCIKEFFAANFHLWLLEFKRQSQFPPPIVDLCYTYQGSFCAGRIEPSMSSANCP